MDPNYKTTPEAADVLGVTEKTLRAWRCLGVDDEGHAKCGPSFIRRGRGRGHIFYAQEELDRYMREGQRREARLQQLPAVPSLDLPEVPDLL